MSKRTSLLLILVFLAFLVCVTEVSAATLRGRVDGQRPGNMQPFPVAQARVDLFQNYGGQWRHVGVAFTGPDGMYYFQGVPNGYFMLLLNGRNRYPLEVYPVPMQDIPPLLLVY